MAEFKTRLIELLDLSRSFLEQLINDADPAERTASGTWENWSLKDELAHVVAWQFNSLARIAALINAEPLPDFSDQETINRAIYDTNRDHSLAEIVAEADRAYAEYVNLIESISEADLTQPARFSEQERRSLASQIMGNGYEHPIFHYATHYWQRGDTIRATELQEASAAAVADMPEWYGSARYNLACMYALTGQADKALAELGAALQLNPGLVEWSKQDSDLASLHDHPVYRALYQA
jgi:tetratricopeptide (TPR) repeat protein